MIYRFGAYELDEARGELRRDGKPVAIQPKPLALLGLLLRERERVVPSDEILETLWPDTVVTPGSLNRAVSHARRAIGDTHAGRWIRSVARRGYRFAGEVTEQAASRAAGAPAPAPERPFVGRADALAQIRSAWARALGDRTGGVVVVSGPPGIGKTQLTERASREIEASGALALVGRAREGEGVPAFWPFAQALRRLLDQPAAADSLGEVAAHEPELAALLGLRTPPATPAQAPEQRRFLLFDAVCRALRREARRQPLLLVLEDVQWAGVESLRLLEHLAHERLDAPLLVLATVREEPRAPGDPVERTLGLLRAQDRCTAVALQPFSRAEVAALLEQVLAKPAPPELTSELFARTEGVPLFLREALRLLGDRGALARPERVPREGVVLPARALDLIRRPLERLSPAATALVSAAAVLGREFELPAAAGVAGQERAAALDAVDEAVAAGVLEPAGGAAAFRFTHALFQEAALAALAPGARARLHLRAAEHLERENEGDPSALLAELAHHRHRALALGEPERACEAALRAAAHAARRGAWEQAALHTEQAREAFEHVPGCDPERRLALALDATEAWRLASERSRRRQSAQAAFELARALGKPRELARAAIGLLDLQEWAVRDEVAHAAVEEALAAVRGSGGVEEARLVTRLAYLEIRTSHVSASKLARQAVELARAAGDPDALQDALYTLHFSLGGPDGLAERSTLAQEIEAVAAASRSADRSLIALLDTAGDRFELGDRPGALRLREAARRVAGPRPHLGMRWHLEVYDTGVALLEGRLDEVEGRIEAAYSAGRRAEHPYARSCANGHRALLARERGDAAGVLEALAPALRAREGPGHWVHALVGRAELASGRPRDARSRFELLAARDFTDVPRNLRWTDTLIEIAHLCAELEDVERAGTLAALLAPYADHHGILPLAICYGGPASWALAKLAALRGNRREARALYDAAAAACEAIGAEAWRARIEREAEGRAAAAS